MTTKTRGRRKATSNATDDKKARLRELAQRLRQLSDEERSALAIKIGGIVTIEGHRCSAHNTIFVWQQRPGASVVGGYRQWLAAGRQVRQGEKAIYLLAPRTSGKDTDDEELYFVFAPVFDITQTEPAEEAGAV